MRGGETNEQIVYNEEVYVGEHTQSLAHYNVGTMQQDYEGIFDNDETFRTA